MKFKNNYFALYNRVFFLLLKSNNMDNSIQGITTAINRCSNEGKTTEIKNKVANKKEIELIASK